MGCSNTTILNTDENGAGQKNYGPNELCDPKGPPLQLREGGGHGRRSLSNNCYQGVQTYRRLAFSPMQTGSYIEKGLKRIIYYPIFLSHAPPSVIPPNILSIWYSEVIETTVNSVD